MTRAGTGLLDEGGGGGGGEDDISNETDAKTLSYISEEFEVQGCVVPRKTGKALIEVTSACNEF